MNLLAYPRGVPDGQTASTLAALTGASFVVRLHSSSGPRDWELYLQGSGVDFPIESGHGYLVNMPEARTVQLPFRSGWR